MRSNILRQRSLFTPLFTASFRCIWQSRLKTLTLRNNNNGNDNENDNDNDNDDNADNADDDITGLPQEPANCNARTARDRTQ